MTANRGYILEDQSPNSAASSAPSGGYILEDQPQQAQQEPSLLDIFPIFKGLANTVDPNGPLGEAGNAAGALQQGISDIQGFPGKVENSISNFGETALTPSSIMGAIKQTLPLAIGMPTGNFPVYNSRGLQNLVAGTAKTSEDFVNLPSDIQDELIHLGLNPKEDAIPKLDIAKYAKPSGQEPGDVLVQSYPGIMGALMPFEGTISKGVALGADLATGSSKYGELASKLAEQQKAVQSAKTSYRQARDQDIQQKAEQDDAKYQSTVETGKSNPGSMQNEINTRQDELTNLKNNMQALSFQMDNVPELPEVPVSDTSHLENLKTAAENSQNAENNLALAHQHDAQSADQVANAESAINEYLDPKANHHVVSAKLVAQDGLQMRANAQNDFSEMMERNADNPVIFSEQAKKEQDLHALVSAKANMLNPAISMRNKKFAAPEVIESPELAELNKLAPTSADTKLRSFMDKYRNFRDARFRLVRDLGSDPDAERVTRRRQAFAYSQKLQDSLEGSIRDSLGEEDSAELDRLNSQYRDIYRLEDNKTFKQAMNGSLPNDIIDSISPEASEPNEARGQELVRNLVLNNPNTLKAVIGERFRANPNNIYNADKETSKYINKDSLLNGLLNNRQQALDMSGETKQKIALAEKQYKDATAKEQEAADNASDKEKEISSQKKEHESQVAERNKTIADLQKEMTMHLSKIRENEIKIPLLQRHIDNLNKLSQKKSVSKIDLTKYTDQLQDAKERLKELKQESKNAHFGYQFLLNKVKNIPVLGPLIAVKLAHYI